LRRTKAACILLALLLVNLSFVGFVWEHGQIMESEQEAFMHAIDMRLLSRKARYATSTCIVFVRLESHQAG
jgi:hypothetical protein